MPNPEMSDYDETTSFLGNYGCFQILIIALLGLSGVPCGYMGVIVVFVSDTPEHHCKVWSNSTVDGAHVEPPFHERSSWIGPDSCSRYKARANWTGPVELGNATEECVDGWVYSTEIYTATIVSEVSVHFLCGVEYEYDNVRLGLDLNMNVNIYVFCVFSEICLAAT